MSPQAVFKYQRFVSGGERMHLPGLIPALTRGSAGVYTACAPRLGVPGQMLVGRKAPLPTAAAQRRVIVSNPLQHV